MRINRQDTNGVKPLLAVGELGYDNYPSGGDAGRVYVGTGSSNIAQAKKSEVVTVDGKVDTHVARVDNPHGVTKLQIGLGNAEDTADNTKNVLSATKLTTARTIGGVSFDGTTNISLPGVNTAGNQNTTGSAAKWTTARTVTLSGDVTGSVSIDGSANVTITNTLATPRVVKTSDTGSARLPVGTTGQRDASPVDGMIRYNSTTLGFEGYFNGSWQSVGGGQMFGQALVKAVSYNAQTISENITVTAGLNAYSVGDITINNGYTVTVENGSVYKIL